MTAENQALKWPIQVVRKHCGCYDNPPICKPGRKIILHLDCLWLLFKNPLLIAVTFTKLNYLDLGEMCLSCALCFGSVYSYPIKIWTAFTFPVPRVLCATQEEKPVTIPYPLDWHLPFPFQHWDQLHMILQLLLFLHLTNKAPIKCKRKVSKHILTSETKATLFYGYSQDAENGDLHNLELHNGF